jgi:uncharacterized peroxidase-related enzyme
MSETTIASSQNDPPLAFTQDEIGWAPWLTPLSEDHLTERHWAGLVDASRAKSPYFMLLARDPEILEARTKTDRDIFYNLAGGLPRAERELSAAAASRKNGCIFCASVHARFASTYSKRRQDSTRASRSTSTNAGTPSSPHRWRSSGRLLRSTSAMSNACAFPDSTISVSSTLSTAPPSSVGRIV